MPTERPPGSRSAMGRDRRSGGVAPRRDERAAARGRQPAVARAGRRRRQRGVHDPPAAGARGATATPASRSRCSCNRPFVDAYPDLVDSFPTVVCPLSGRSKPCGSRPKRPGWPERPGGTVSICCTTPAARFPLLRATPSLVTIHDLQPLFMPANFSDAKPATCGCGCGRPRSARASSSRSPTTHAERSSACSVCPSTAPRSCRPATRRPSCRSPSAIPRADYRLDRPFFLYPGDHLPAQEPSDAAFGRSPARWTKGVDALLVLTASADVVEDSMLALIDSLGIRDRVPQARARAARRSRLDVPQRPGADVPLAVRGVRLARARGDGQRLPRDRGRRHCASRGRR